MISAKGALAVTAFLAFTAFSIAVKHRVIAAGELTSVGAIKMGAPLPDLTLKDREGHPVQLGAAAASHKLVMVNFWGVWCGPCRLEMPGFQRMYADTAYAGLEILAIDENDSPEELSDYLKTRTLTFPILVDSGGRIADRLRINAYPTTIFIDSTRKVVNIVQGVEPYLPNLVTNLLATYKPKK